MKRLLSVARRFPQPQTWPLPGAEGKPQNRRQPNLNPARLAN